MDPWPAPLVRLVAADGGVAVARDVHKEELPVVDAEVVDEAGLAAALGAPQGGGGGVVGGCPEVPAPPGGTCGECQKESKRLRGHGKKNLVFEIEKWGKMKKKSHLKQIKTFEKHSAVYHHTTAVL